jgi:hypothetical protein
MRELLKTMKKLNFSINTTVKATIQNGELDYSKPKINIEILVTEINGFLESKQYQSTIEFAGWLTKKIRQDKYQVFF